MNHYILHTYRSSILLSKIMGSLFVSSALLKLLALQNFQGEMRLYLEAYFPSIFIGHEHILAISLCIMELFIGIYAITGFMRKRVSIVFVIILSFFVWLTGMNLFFPSLLGRIESCGCFGELIHFTPTESFIKSLLLWIMSTTWFYMEFFSIDLNMSPNKKRR